MPAMFGRANWWRRDLGFRVQVGSNRTLMASSETARSDMERFYPRSRGRIHVVRFAIELDIERLMKREREIRSTYGIDGRFFFLPNQFWRHKNHAIIVRALAKLRADRLLHEVPPILLSGLRVDSRDPGYFDRLMADVEAAGISSHFRYLGLIPYDDVLALISSCDGLINPSYFEGWSTPIEEAKALGAPLILSDIPIHREQAPHASFFDPDNDNAAASALRTAVLGPKSPRLNLPDLVLAQSHRLDAHADRLLKAVRAAALS
jgi:glycosyltransferase involved in cell wall biosynthesis